MSNLYDKKHSCQEEDCYAHPQDEPSFRFCAVFVALVLASCLGAVIGFYFWGKSIGENLRPQTQEAK